VSQPTHQLEHLPELPTIFRSAATHIELYGLAQDWYCAPGAGTEDIPIGECPTCTVGACSWAQTGSPTQGVDNAVVADATQFLAQHLGIEIRVDSTTGEPDYVDTVATWNDAPERTADEVVAFLRRMAAEAAEVDLLCRYIREHDDHQPYEWGAVEFGAYRAELTALRLAAAA